MFINNQDDDHGVSKTFNVVDLTPYFGLEESESRTTPFLRGEDDMTTSTTPASNILQPQIQATPTQVSPTSTPAQLFDGPITRSRAKKLQQEVNALLCEIHFNINENYILPKSCTLLLLRFTKEDGKNTKGEEYRERPRSNPTSPAKQSKRSSHNFSFPKAIKVNVDILESLSILLSNTIQIEYFELPTNEIRVHD